MSPGVDPWTVAGFLLSSCRRVEGCGLLSSLKPFTDVFTHLGCVLGFEATIVCTDGLS